MPSFSRIRNHSRPLPPLLPLHLLAAQPTSTEHATCLQQASRRTTFKHSTHPPPRNKPTSRATATRTTVTSTPPQPSSPQATERCSRGNPVCLRGFERVSSAVSSVWRTRTGASWRRGGSGAEMLKPGGQVGTDGELGQHNPRHICNFIISRTLGSLSSGLHSLCCTSTVPYKIESNRSWLHRMEEG